APKACMSSTPCARREPGAANPSRKASGVVLSSLLLGTSVASWFGSVALLAGKSLLWSLVLLAVTAAVYRRYDVRSRLKRAIGSVPSFKKALRDLNFSSLGRTELWVQPIKLSSERG